MKKIIALILIGVFVFVAYAQATDYSSSNFTVKDPVIAPAGGFATSGSFGLWSVLGELAPGTSAGSTINLKSGFLFFLNVLNPPTNLSAATQSSGQINLSWTDNSTNETGFKIERKTGAGGSYSQIAIVGANVTSYPDTGLSPSTTYFYQVRAFNAEGNSGYSNESGATTQSSGGNNNNGGGGGGGGGGGYIIPSSGSATIVLIGKAYPSSAITVLVDGNIKANATADSFASFNISVDSTAGVHSFSIYSTDNNGQRSLTYTFTMSLNTGAISTVAGIFLAPTISVDKSEVKKGDPINIVGQTAPSSTVTVYINSTNEVQQQVPTDKYGLYSLSYNTLPLDYGDHSTKSQAAFLDDTLSAFSQTVNFTVSTRNVAKNISGDLNKNGKVNIVDFSILLYWWGKTTPQALNVADINGDGKIDLTDLSIMLYYWTG